MSGFLMLHFSSVLFAVGIAALVVLVGLVFGYIYYDQVILGRVYDYLYECERAVPDVYGLVSCRRVELQEFHEQFLYAKYNRQPTGTYYKALATLLALSAQLDGPVYFCRGYCSSAQAKRRLQLWDDDTPSYQTSAREVLWLEFSYNRRAFAAWLTEDGCGSAESVRIFRRLLRIKTVSARCCLRDADASILRYLR